MPIGWVVDWIGCLSDGLGAFPHGERPMLGARWDDGESLHTQDREMIVADSPVAWLLSVAVVFGPGLVLVLAGAGAVVASRGTGAARLVPLAVTSTAGWLAFVALVPHENPCGVAQVEGCPNVFGSSAPLDQPSLWSALIVVVAFAVPALWAGLARRVHPLAVGAALTLGPMLVAWPTSPRGDGDGLWVLTFVYLGVFGWGAALLALLCSAPATSFERRRVAMPRVRAATAPDRMLAALIDVVVVGAVLVWPLTVMSHAGREVWALVVGVVVGVAALAVPVTLTGGTLGQRLFGLSVIDGSTGARVSAAKAVARASLFVVEVVATVTIVLGALLAAEALMLVVTGASLTDRVTGSTVMSGVRGTAGCPDAVRSEGQ